MPVRHRSLVAGGRGWDAGSGQGERIQPPCPVLARGGCFDSPLAPVAPVSRGGRWEGVEAIHGGARCCGL